eukprot:425479_1
MALFFVSLVVITSQAQTQCTTSTTGSTVDNEYQDFKIETSLSTTSKSFIRFNTCFLEITFDTYLYLYNNERTTIIGECDDHCNKQNRVCIKNGRASHDTIWDLNVNTLTDSEYILQLAGYNSEEGSFKLMLSYDCQHNINISAVYPEIPETTTIISTALRVPETTTIINTVLRVPETTTTSTSIINSSFACDEEYPCPFIISNVEGNGTAFYFNVSVVDNILQDVVWDKENFNVYNHRTEEIINCLVLRNAGMGVVDDNNMSIKHFQKGDFISFTDVDVYCDGKLCRASASDTNWINVIAVIVTLSLICVCCPVCLIIICFSIKVTTDDNLTMQMFKILKVSLQIVISGCSIVGSMALSGAFGFSQHDSGVMAVTMGVIIVFLAYCRIVFGLVASRSVEDDPDTGARTSPIAQGIILTINICLATLIDATFDIFQGIAAINEQEYTTLSATILVIATWTGVGEEIAEGVFEIGTIIFTDCFRMGNEFNVFVSTILQYVIMIACMMELCMGIYLFSTFSDAVYVGMGIGLQSLGLLFVILWFCIVTLAMITDCG